MKESKEYEEMQLFSSLNDYQINEVCVILTENNIPFVRKDNGAGAYMNLYMGHSLQEKRIFVNKKDYNKAHELISVITDINEDETIEEGPKEENRMSNTLTLISKIAIWTVLILPVLLIVLMAILVIFQ